MLDVDPRPDMKSDSALWTQLLQQAIKVDPNLAGALHAFRCQGTRLKKGQIGYALRPDIDPKGDIAWRSRKEYDEEKRKWLDPYREEIIELLRKI